MPKHNMYCVRSNGLALGAETTVLADSPVEAKKLHAETLGGGSDFTKNVTCKLLQKNVVLIIDGVDQPSFVFSADNGDY